MWELRLRPCSSSSQSGSFLPLMSSQIASSSVLNISRDEGGRSGLRTMSQGGLLGGGSGKEAGSCRRGEIRVVLGQSPLWPFCSPGKGSGQSAFSLPGDPEGRGLWSCQVISGLGLPFNASSQDRQRIISTFRQLHPSFRNYTCLS